MYELHYQCMHTPFTADQQCWFIPVKGYVTHMKSTVALWSLLASLSLWFVSLSPLSSGSFSANNKLDKPLNTTCPSSKLMTRSHTVAFHPVTHSLFGVVTAHSLCSINIYANLSDPGLLFITFRKFYISVAPAKLII